jgi:hypothetical protein
MTLTGLQWHNGHTEFRENLSNGSEVGTGEASLHERTRRQFGDLINLVNL